MRNIVWISIAIAASASPARAKPDDLIGAVTKVIEAQLAEWDETRSTSDPPKPGSAFTRSAWISSTGNGNGVESYEASTAGGMVFMGTAKKHKLHDVRAHVSADGKAAWTSFAVTATLETMGGDQVVEYRASELLVRDGERWQIAEGAWSVGSANAAVNKAAKKPGELVITKIVDNDEGPADVLDAFRAMFANGFDATAAASKDLIGIGSAPGELTVGGKALAPGFKKAWVGHVTIDGAARVVLAPSGTTASVLANVQLEKGAGKAAYKIPFRVFVVFDKVGAGWSVVHVHFAVPMAR